MFYVYNSNSQGSARVSQGYEKHKTKDGKDSARLIKGAERSPQYQYTQDGQVNPKVLSEIHKILDTQAQENAVPVTHMLHGVFDEKQAKHLKEDYQNLVKVEPLKYGIDSRFYKLRTGDLGKNDFKTLYATEDPAEQQALLRKDIANLNTVLAEADVIPDFSQMPAIGMGEHPVLGPYASEVYTKVVDGRTLEWHMGRDSQGRVWVERIRFADSQANAYGGDEEIPFIGILPTKPLEYKGQVDGLPEAWRKPSADKKYDDISGFLDQLLPIQRYHQTAITPGMKLMYADGLNF
jgi:hypothetical protein